jgi:hypothetical protein
MSAKEVQLAALSIAGVLIGAWITSSSAEKVANAQIFAQQQLARSEAAMKLIDYAASPMADVYAANIKLQQYDPATMDEAARQLAVAAAIGAARIGGNVANRCMNLSKAADKFGKIPLSDLKSKTNAAGEIGVGVTELMHAYDDYRNNLQKEVLPPRADAK